MTFPSGVLTMTLKTSNRTWKCRVISTRAVTSRGSGAAFYRPRDGGDRRGMRSRHAHLLRPLWSTRRWYRRLVRLRLYRQRRCGDHLGRVGWFLAHELTNRLFLGFLSQERKQGRWSQSKRRLSGILEEHADVKWRTRGRTSIER